MEFNVTFDLYGLEVARVTKNVIYHCNSSCSNTTKPIDFTINYGTV